MKPTLNFWQALPAMLVLYLTYLPIRLARPVIGRLELHALEQATNELGLRVGDLFELSV